MEKPHKQLDAWKLSMDLAIDVYRITASFPRQEQYLDDKSCRALNERMERTDKLISGLIRHLSKKGEA